VAQGTKQSARGTEDAGHSLGHPPSATSPGRFEAAVFERERLWSDARDDHGPFDIVGDMHGCFDEESGRMPGSPAKSHTSTVAGPRALSLEFAADGDGVIPGQCLKVGITGQRVTGRP
jgi:hypothetical protein